MVEDRARSWGQRAINSSAEAWLSNITDNARARFNFRFDRHGRVEGEADVLLPLYDTPRALFFTQLGVRSMDVSVPDGEANGKDRWIGNFGLGHRFFPNAGEETSGNWMFGYNAFFDRDFTRSHDRGGVGVELQYDRVRFSSNAYVPISGWRDSRDFDRRFRETHPGKRMEERPARGWDAHVEAALPFYPGLAFTGGLTQWYGDKVDALGHGTLEKDPRVWDYGVKYTPFPLFTASVTQRNTEGGRQDTVVGLSLTYRFGMPWSQQINPARVRDLATVGGARYEFVKRENRMPLARRERRVEGGGSAATPGPTPILSVSYNRTEFVTADFSATATITVQDAEGNDVTIDGNVEWSVLSSSISSSDVLAWHRTSRTLYNGLNWGDTALPLSSDEGDETTVSGSVPTGKTAYLTDIVGSREVVVQAKMTIDGTAYTVQTASPVTFGPGPLSVFDAGMPTKNNRTNGSGWWPGDMSLGEYQSDLGLPTTAQLQAVSGPGSGGHYGAAYAAAWPISLGSYRFYDGYWTGDAEGCCSNLVSAVGLANGEAGGIDANNNHDNNYFVYLK